MSFGLLDLLRGESSGGSTMREPDLGGLEYDPKGTRQIRRGMPGVAHLKSIGIRKGLRRFEERNPVFSEFIEFLGQVPLEFHGSSIPY